jgi:replicative DNA helicase
MESVTFEPLHDEITERHVLGSILYDNKILSRVDDALQIHSFYVPLHQEIFAAILKCQKKGIIANHRTLKFVIDNASVTDDLEGYLERLASDPGIFSEFERLVAHLNELYVRRGILNFAQNILEIARDNKLCSFDHVLARAEDEFFILNNLHKQSNMRHIKEIADTVLKQIQSSKHDELNGVTSGFSSLDNLTGGFQKSDLIILAARPSMGKTALGINLAIKAAEYAYESKKKGDVLFFSLEMSSDQIATRAISMLSGVDSFKLKNRKVSNEEIARILKCIGRMDDLPLFIDDTPALTAQALKSKIRKIASRQEIGLIVIDYLQLLYSAYPGRKQANRVMEVSEITRILKEIAKEMNVPVIALSQLSRGVESREKNKKRPQLSDLRESGSIEQDADLVLFIYREAYYLMNDRPTEGTKEHETWQEKMDKVRNITELIIAKHRNGPVGSVNLNYDPNKMIFTDSCHYVPQEEQID